MRVGHIMADLIGSVLAVSKRLTLAYTGRVRSFLKLFGQSMVDLMVSAVAVSKRHTLKNFEPVMIALMPVALIVADLLASALAILILPAILGLVLVTVGDGRWAYGG